MEFEKKKKSGGNGAQGKCEFFLGSRRFGGKNLGKKRARTIIRDQTRRGRPGGNRAKKDVPALKGVKPGMKVMAGAGQGGLAKLPGSSVEGKRRPFNQGKEKKKRVAPWPCLEGTDNQQACRKKKKKADGES